ncbi:MAG TPA: bifunctional folylpolyglutamate synthase/dihydrofolate synthase [bacterium]|nr:bifunctional folylpolyglutamate synthase/dihydrofolate synthase [bacterium]
MVQDFKKYDTTVDYLYSLQKHGIKLGLANTGRLMNILGEPHKSFHSIHIAGTNGKGSTATAVASVLKENGLRTGLFTSPHLVSFTERIRINNQKISEADVIDLASMIRKSISGTDLNPTFFEFVTAMAFYYFAKQNVDWVVVETGMGGRLDATNVIQPDITVVTNISLDHCEFLGSSISDIAFEKAGIIKTGVPVVTASDNPEVLSQLSDAAKNSDADLHIYNEDFGGTLLRMDDKSMSLDYFGYTDYRDLEIPVSGQYQLYNICTAIRVCELLRKKGFSISDISIKNGLRNLNLEGRLERVSDSPPIFLDGAHNPDAAASLADSIREIFPDKKIILVAGIMNDKDAGRILSPLVQTAETVILTRPEYERAASPDKLNNVIKDIRATGTTYSPIAIESTQTVAEAINLAKSRCGKNNIILVTGSFYTIGESKEVQGCDIC